MNIKFDYLKIIAFSFLIIIFVGFTHSALISAENPKGEAVSGKSGTPSPAPQNQNKDDNTISKDDVKLFIKQVQIYGQIAKPQAVFINPGSDPKVDGLKINRHFFDHIFRNVEKSSLKHVQKRRTNNNTHIQW